MNPTSADVKRATDMAHVLESQGYFAKAKSGDEKGASYFARMVASKVNPSGKSNDWGWLKKTGSGTNVEGYADGAIVFGNNPSDLNNVLKIVTQIGTDHAGIGDAVQERRTSDIWDNPVPMPDSIQIYLLNDSPNPVKTVPWVAYDEQGFQKLKKMLKHDYDRRPQGADFDVSVWAGRYFHNCYMGPDGTPLGEDAALKKIKPELCAALGIPVDNYYGE